MARPRRVASSNLSPGQAHYVIERLLRDRKITSSEISEYVSDMGREIGELEERLRRLRDVSPAAQDPVVAETADASAPAVPATRRGRRPRKAAGAGAPAAAPKARKARKTRKKKSAEVTPEQAASRALQGRYIALVRRFPVARRKHYAKIARTQDREVAIRQMQAALAK